MTKEEAIRCAMDYCPVSEQHPKYIEASAAIDRYVRLGMLKLDEPKSAHQRMVEACRGLDISGRMIDLFATALKNSGLEVVEKKGES